MRRAERLFRIVHELRTRSIIRAADLATQFEVSISTIYRDIAHLQASGMPIEGEAGIGYLLRPGFDLPNVTFTHDQLDALAIGLSFVEKVGDPNLRMAAKEVRAKLQAAMPVPEERKLADAPFHSLVAKSCDPPFLTLLRQAIRDRIVVEIKYQNALGETSTRCVHPLVIWALNDGWMFSGWCVLRSDFRTFRLDRIAALQPQKAHFQEDAARGLNAFLSQEACAG